MLAPFEYICRCSTGSELYAALQLKDVITAKIDHQNLSVPYSGMHSPCSRCWIYDPIIDQEYCSLCKKINDMSSDHGLILQEFTLVWGYFPTPKWTGEPILPKSTLGFFIKDCQHVLIMCPKSSIQDWLRSLALLYSQDLKGLIQIFPTMGKGEVICMGDILSRAIHQESVVQPNQLWVRFFPEAWQLLEAKKRDEQGILTFNASDFIAFIEKSKIYSDIIPHRFRSDIYELLTSDKLENKSYYWGKIQKSLSKKAIDLIDAWQLRLWDSLQIKTLYSLLQYANPTRSY